MPSRTLSLISVFTAVLFGAVQSQEVYEGPYVGDVETRQATRLAEWYCNVTRIVGCVKYNHICFVELIFGDDRCDPVTAQSTRCPTRTDAERCDQHDDIATITHFQGFVGNTDTAIAGLKFFSDEGEYLVGSDEQAFDTGVQIVDGNIVGLKYERNDDFDYVGLLLSKSPDEEIRAQLEASQAAKAELMEEYNEALANAAAAENRRDADAAAQFDAEAARIYARIVTANVLEGEIISEAENALLGLPLWAVIVILAAIIIVILLTIVMIVKCIRKNNQKDANTMKVSPQEIPQSVDTEKDSVNKSSKLSQAEYYSQNQATDVNMESGDNKPVADKDEKVSLGL